MTAEALGKGDRTGTLATGRNNQVLVVTLDEDQLCGVDHALRQLSWKRQVATSLVDALNSRLEDYRAIVLDEALVARELSDVLDQMLSRAPQTSLFVACDMSSRETIVTTIATRGRRPKTAHYQAPD